MRKQTNKIFISYRRDDTRADARSIFQHLARVFGGEQIFMDVDSIDKGRDFRNVLDTALKRCRVMLVVIGPNWLDSRDVEQRRRLEDPNDFVRVEIATALSRNIVVIPVRIDGTPLPAEAQLPAELQPLTWRQAHIVTHDQFTQDMGGLEKEIGKLVQSKRSRWTVVRIAACMVLTTAAFGAISFYYYLSPSSNKAIKSANSSGLRVVDFSVIDRPDAILDFHATWLEGQGSDDRAQQISRLGRFRGSFPILDIKLLNTGSATVFIKKIDFVVSTKSVKEEEISCGSGRVSWVYNVSFSGSPSVKSLQLSQIIKPNEADRIAIYVGQDFGKGYPFVFSATYQFTAVLHFNESDTVQLGTHTINVDDQSCSAGGQMTPDILRVRTPDKK